MPFSTPPTILTTIFSLLLTLAHASPLPFPQSGDGGSTSNLPSGAVGYDPDVQGGTDTGADGRDTGSVGLSKGAIIAIAVVAGVAIIGGVSTAILFFIAKRRQWQLAARMRRSVKRVGTGLVRVMTPRTPHKMTFSPLPEKSSRKKGSQANKAVYDEDDELLRTKSLQGGDSPDRSRSRGRNEKDGEKGQGKGLGLATTNTDGADGTGHQRPLSTVQEDGFSKVAPGEKEKSGGRVRPARPPPVTVPQSSFEMDSPKTPIWSKIFGR